MNAQSKLNNLMGSLIATASLAASAQILIKLPEGISAAPITGQSLVVLLMGWILPWNWGAATIIFYLLLGGLGLPVFADFASGTEVLLGSSMGYFIGFLIAVIYLGKRSEKKSAKFTTLVKEFALASIVILIFGGLFLLRHMSLGEVFSKGIQPFLIGALVKVLLGSVLLKIYLRASTFLKNIPQP